MKYTLKGENHYMSEAEIGAIERSGFAHRVQDYAMGMYIREHTNREPLAQTLRDMGCRPETTYGGGLVDDSAPAQIGDTAVARIDLKLHLSGAPCTLMKRQHVAIDDNTFRRKHAITPGLVCKTCLRILHRIS